MVCHNCGKEIAEGQSFCSACGQRAILLLIFLTRDSAPGTNQYGPNPKGV